MRSQLTRPPQASTPTASQAETNRHTRGRRTIGALCVLLALGLACAAGAQATSTNDLGWKVNGKALGEGETTPITAVAENTQVFKQGILFRIECSKLELLSSKLVGVKSPAPGKAEGRIAYSGCVLVTTECKVSGVTKPLVMTNAYLTKAAAEKEEIAPGPNGLLLAPKEGEVFIEFVVSRGMTGSCPFEKPVTFTFSGSTIERVFKGSKETTYNEEAQTHSIEGTALKAYFENEGGTTVEHPGVGLKQAGAEATWSGKAGVSVTAGSKFNLSF